MRHALATVIALLATTACSGKPTAPTPPASSTSSTSTTTTSMPATWSVSGRLTSLQSGEPLAGVNVSTPGPSGSQTDASGGYALGGSNPTFTPYLMTFEHPAILTRDVYKTWERTAQTLDATAIELRAPFSLDFYRQFVRGTLDYESQPLRRWTVAPQIYLNATDGSGRPLAPSDVILIRDSATEAVRQLTGFSIAAFEFGTEMREPRQNWITIDVIRSNEDVCGRSPVGANPGRITLNYGRCRVAACGTAELIPEVVAHEIGHAMGFFHQTRANGIMNPMQSRNCKNIRFADEELYHAAIAYRRPLGNIEPDRDPRSPATSLASLIVIDR